MAEPHLPLRVQPQLVSRVPPPFPKLPHRSIHTPAPDVPGSWGRARADQSPPATRERRRLGGLAAPVTSGLLCLQQHPRITVSDQLSGVPTQSDFLHSAALPIPGHRATAGGPWSPRQRGQRGNRASAPAAWGLGTAAASSLWLPTLSLSSSTGQNRQQEIAPETRAYPWGQGTTSPSAPMP